VTVPVAQGDQVEIHVILPEHNVNSAQEPFELNTSMLRVSERDSTGRAP
jgi:hypothetical protein